MNLVTSSHSIVEVLLIDPIHFEPVSRATDGSAEDDRGSSMVEGVNVKFRWFRTIETDSRTVSLVSVDRKWDDVQLHWDNLNLLYESGPTYVPCGRHEATLIVGGADRHYDCDGFTVVATTFEVSIFLVDDSEFLTRNSFHRPVSRNDDFWSPGRNVGNITADRSHILRLETRTTKVPVYEEALAAKDREIANLKLQLGQLKCALIAGDVGRPPAAETRDSATDCGGLGSDGISELRVMVYSDDSNHEDPIESERLNEEMRALRKELRICCHKNKLLDEEVFNLRAENTRLSRDHSLGLSTRPCTVDVCCFSDPESSSTQYRALPIIRSFASLPAVLGSSAQGCGRRARRRVVRRPAIVASPDTPLTCSDSGSLCTDELLSYGTPPLSVGSAGVQTDITAVAGKPKRLKPRVEVKRRLFNAGKETRSGVGNGRTKATSRHWKSRTRAGDGDGDSDDTEDLLLEADKFVATVFGTGYLEPVVGKSFASSKKLESSRSTSSIHVGFSSINHGAKDQLRPFIPKCAADLRVGHSVRYLGPTGLVTQGRVTSVGPLMDRAGVFVGVESVEEGGSNTHGHPYRNADLTFYGRLHETYDATSGGSYWPLEGHVTGSRHLKTAEGALSSPVALTAIILIAFLFI